MSVERCYYRIQPDSPVMAVIQQALEKQREFRTAVEGLQKELPGAVVWTQNSTIVCGAQFTGDLPPGWRQGPKRYAVPNKRTSEGRALDRRLKALPRGVDAMAFATLMTANLSGLYEYYGDDRIAWTTYQKYGDVYILSVPVGCKVHPPACDELKMSEYWAIREQAEVARSVTELGSTVSPAATVSNEKGKSEGVGLWERQS